MKVKSIPSSWISRDGLRLDCNPYMTGALEARIRLDELSCPKERLEHLCEGGISGLVNAGRITRQWVEDPAYGIPFLTSTSILQPDLSKLRFISKRAVRQNPKLLIRKGYTLITRAGSIGRMAYARPDMDGMACTEDVLRVIPDREKVPPGYLYAFLSSRFGVPLVTSGTYGAIIQHIEPEHIAGLPVPRLGEELELKIHILIEEGARLRTDATDVLNQIANDFDALVPPGVENKKTPRVTTVNSSYLQRRLDAQYHDPEVQRIRSVIAEGAYTSIGKLCTTIFLPGIFKRIHIEDASYGAPYYTGATLFWLEPLPKGILSRRTKLFDQVELHIDTILVQAFGQDGGLTGKAVWVGRNLDRMTTTHMLCRLKTPEREMTAYLYGYLNSRSAQAQISVLTYGGSIPHFDEDGISTVVIPLIGDDAYRREIGQRILCALDNREKALELERHARTLVEQAIEAGP